MAAALKRKLMALAPAERKIGESWRNGAESCGGWQPQLMKAEPAAGAGLAITISTKSAMKAAASVSSNENISERNESCENESYQ
jgi:hypothetical protein